MLFDRFCRKSVAPAPRRAGGTARRALGISLALLPLVGSPVLEAHAAAGKADPLVPVARPAPLPLALRSAEPLGRLSADTTVNLTLSLPWRDSADLDVLLRRLYDPTDSLYQKYLTHQQFLDRFAPSAADYAALKNWAAANGLTVTGSTASRKLLMVSGKRDAVESTFHVTLSQYRLTTGRVVYANDARPALPQSVAAHVSGVIGLTNYSSTRPYSHLRRDLYSGPHPLNSPTPFAAAGTGPLTGLSPADIKSVYSIQPLSDAGLDGTGQTVAVWEAGGYDTTDIAGYAKAFNLFDPTAGTSPTLKNVLIGGYNGVPNDPGVQGEVTLDIEMIMAVAPKANILVYEYDETKSAGGGMALLARIADDNIAKLISYSYGRAEEDSAFFGELIPENEIFKQMAAQGQSMFAASGDDGPYIPVRSNTADPGGLQVTLSDPASQPFVTAVGGTMLGTDPIVKGVATYGSELTWFESPLPTPLGGGGGESKYWAKPDYQTGHGSSATMRDIPDVSLLAGLPGYSVYQASEGDTTPGATFGFTVAEGTSASSPLWAAYFALVNQQRAIYALPTIGFANPAIYTAAEGVNYGTEFHDINDGSSNGLYTAVTGFDDATGWGSCVASALLPEFAPSTFGASPINVRVVDANGSPVSGASITVVTPQISGYRLTAVSAADGTASITVPIGVHNYSNSSQDVTLSFIVSADLTGYAGDSRAGISPPTATPITLRILAPDHTYTSGTLQMISAPFDYSTLGDFATLFGLTPPVGTTSGSAQLFAYSPTLTSYLKYPTAPADTLRLGQGYWAVLPSNAYVRRKGVRAPSTQAFRINLLPGWNMIGDPFQGAVPVSSIQVDTVVPGSPVGIGSASTVQLPFYTYNGSAYQTLGTGDSLQPYLGYWIHASQAAELVIPAQ